MADLKTRDLKGVELLAVGTWNGQGCPEGGCEFTQQHIDQAVAAGKELAGTFDAPVKLGHDDDQKLLQSDGYPAAGWVKNLRRSGQKLIGDLIKVPEKVAALMEAGAYRKRSVELKEDYKVDGKTYPLVLTGLALLGADLPAVGGLKDITKLYQSLALALDDDAHVVMFEEDEDDPPDVDTLVAELDEWLRKAKPRFRGKPGSPTLQSLHRALREGLKRTAKALKKDDKEDDVDEQAIRKLLSIDDDADIAEAIAALQTQLKDRDEADPDRAEVAKLSRELLEAQGRILTMENDHERALLETREELHHTQAKQVVDLSIAEGRIAPRNRELAMSFALKGSEQFDKFVGNLPGVDLSERGTSAGDLNLAELEPTAQEITLAKEMGVWSEEYRKQLIRDKATARGVAIPVDAQPAEQKA